MTDPQESWQLGQPLNLIEGAHACFEREARFQHGDVHPTKKQVAKLLSKDRLWFAKSQSQEMLAAAEFIELENGSKHKLFAGRELTIAPGAVVVKRFGARPQDSENMKPFFDLVKSFVTWICSEGDPAELWFEIFEEDLSMKAVAQRMGLKYYGTKVVGQGQIRGLYAIADLKPEALPVHERVGLKVLVEDFLDAAEASNILQAVSPPGGPGDKRGPEADLDVMLKRIAAKLSLDELTREQAQPWINLVPPNFKGPRTVYPPPEGDKIQFRVPLKSDPERAHVACWSLRGSIWQLPLRERMLYYLDSRKPHAFFNSATDESAAAELVFDVQITDELRAQMLEASQEKAEASPA